YLTHLWRFLETVHVLSELHITWVTLCPGGDVTGLDLRLPCRGAARETSGAVAGRGTSCASSRSTFPAARDGSPGFASKRHAGVRFQAIITRRVAAGHSGRSRSLDAGRSGSAGDGE